jgi:hypothetical protein
VDTERLIYFILSCEQRFGNPLVAHGVISTIDSSLIYVLAYTGALYTVIIQDEASLTWHPRLTARHSILGAPGMPHCFDGCKIILLLRYDTETD